MTQCALSSSRIDGRPSSPSTGSSLHEVAWQWLALLDFSLVRLSLVLNTDRRIMFGRIGSSLLAKGSSHGASTRMANTFWRFSTAQRACSFSYISPFEVTHDEQRPQDNSPSVTIRTLAKGIACGALPVNQSVTSICASQPTSCAGRQSKALLRRKTRLVPLPRLLHHATFGLVAVGVAQTMPAHNNSVSLDSLLGIQAA